MPNTTTIVPAPYPPAPAAATSFWAEHLETCTDTCAMCAEHRVFGDCASCGAETEAVGADELSRCCGSTVIQGVAA